MDGITILEQHSCRLIELSELIAGSILFTILTVGILALYTYMYGRSDKSTKNTIRICSVLLIFLYGVFWAFLIDGYKRTHMEYTITIDDSVSFNDFYEKYEIVSVDGDKYRVVEKDEKE